jgi:hypothetical protein
MNSLSLAVLAVCVAFAAAQNPWNATEIAEMFINLGSPDRNPSHVNCEAYVDLFQPNATLHSPGVPDYFGSAAIMKGCEDSHAHVNPLLSYQLLNIPVTSWNQEKRVAFRWELNGIRTSDNMQVTTPAITHLFCDRNGKIETAYSYYDDRDLVSAAAPAPVPEAAANGINLTALAAKYMSNCASFRGGLQQTQNCSCWANLFAADGISNEPGLPPAQGTDKLVQICNERAARFKTILPAAELIEPVLSWNQHLRAAIRWTLSGVGPHSHAYVIPAISTFVFNSDGKIAEAWDTWDTSLLPPSN